MEGSIRWLFSLNLNDTPYNGDSHKILELVYVKYVLSTSGLILKTVATFVQKGGLDLATRWFFTSVIQYTNVIVGLKLLTNGINMTTAFLCAEKRNRIRFTTASNRDRGTNAYVQTSLR